MPEGFRPRPDDPIGTPRRWESSAVPLLDGRLRATVGPVHYTQAARRGFFSIDVEIVGERGSRVLSDLDMELERVADDSAHRDAARVVSFDEDSGIVTFDLGRSVFRYQLPPDIEARIAAYSKGR